MSEFEFEDEADSGVYMSISFDVRVIRMMDTMLIPTKLKLRFDINPIVLEDPNALGKTAMRMRAWFNTVVESIVIVASSNVSGLTMLFGPDGQLRITNALMLLHTEPTDDTLAAVFLAKMNALAGLEEDGFLSCDVRSDNPLGLRAAFVGDPRTCLPTIDEWIGERRYFDEPWWHRNDISTYDVQPPPNADLSKKPFFPDVDALLGLGLMDPSLFAEKADDAPVDETNVLRPQFKPTIIDGGKKPDA